MSLANAFREDKLGDRTNFAGTGTYTGDVAKYKAKVKRPLGRNLKKQRIKAMDENPRFFHKVYVKQIRKAKNVLRLTNEVLRTKDDLQSDFCKPYLPIKFFETEVKPEVVNDEEAYQRSKTNPLGLYSAQTENYIRGVGGLGGNEDEVFQDDEVEMKRVDFNNRLRQQPHNIDLWIEFIDFQDEALQEKVFNDKNANKKSRKKNGEILRAKALTERKLAICKSAIEKNTRSIELAVKRLELSRDLFDSAQLDQQWKELIFVYPENIALWKRYLLFIQTHYSRFTIPDTLKAYKSCVVKLRERQEALAGDRASRERLVQLEHGIIDIIEAGTGVLLQSGHAEKAVAVFQGLLEFNLFSSNLETMGDYTVMELLGMLEPVWDRGIRKVGEFGARGWGAELQQRAGTEPLHNQEPGLVGGGELEDRLVQDSSSVDKPSLWTRLEVGREMEEFFPCRSGEEEPVDLERKVNFETIQGFLVLFTSEESKFRLLLVFLRMLGYEQKSKEFSNLTDSCSASIYFNTVGSSNQNFVQDNLHVLLEVLPTYKTKESVAIFIHHLFAQTYVKFKEPFRTKIMLMWMDFECEVVKLNSCDKMMKKNLKKLVKTLLKEDRNNAELVAKYVELEYELSGYDAARALVETSLQSAGSALVQAGAGQLYRAGAELELRQLAAQAGAGGRDIIHTTRLQWLLLQAGSTHPFTPLGEQGRAGMLSLVDGARDRMVAWIQRNMQNCSQQLNFAKGAPFVRHPLLEILFLYAWLVRFTEGLQEAFECLTKYSAQLAGAAKPGAPTRFDGPSLTCKFLQESVDKICFDMLWLESQQDVIMRQNLRQFYIGCLESHPTSGYLLGRLGAVEGSTSVVSSVWREVCRMLRDKSMVNPSLVEQVLRLGLNKFIKVLDPADPTSIPSIGLGFLTQLHNLVEHLVSLPSNRHNPLVWRLLLWTSSQVHPDQESIKTVLYRAIQEVVWCKALYLDTAVYLDRIGQLYTNTRKEIVFDTVGETQQVEEEEEVEAKYEEIPGTLEHITELMIEKELRVRLHLQELDVLLEPLV